MTNLTIRDYIRLEVEKLGSQRAVAREFGVTAQYINDILNGRRSGMSAKILGKLGIKKTVTLTKRTIP